MIDYRTCPYCSGLIGQGTCCERMAKNLAEPIPFARFFTRPPIGTPPGRRPKKRKDPPEDPSFDDAVRVIEDIHEEFP